MNAAWIGFSYGWSLKFVLDALLLRTYSVGSKSNNNSGSHS